MKCARYLSDHGKQQTITLKMADQGRSDLSVVFTMALRALELRPGAIYQGKSSAPEIKGNANPQMYHSEGLKVLNLDLTMFCCGIFYSIILIILCSVNHLCLPGVQFCFRIFLKWLPALAPSLSSGSTQLTLKWEKMTKSSVKNSGHLFLELRLEPYRS